MKTKLFIDVQGFILEENQFIVKEIAILHENNRLTHLIFEPSFSDLALSEQQRIKIDRSTREFHGIGWNDGFVPYYYMEDLLREAVEGEDDYVIYVKGENKKKWLTKYFKNKEIRNITSENFKYSVNEGQYLSCACHHGICALNHVMQMRNWWLNRI